MLFTLLVKGITLPGAYEGISFFFTPKWNELLTIKVWYSALNQLFFSLGIATGQLINYSSHNEFSQDIYRDAIFLSFADTFTSVLAGATIFSILGNLASLKNVQVEEVIFLNSEFKLLNEIKGTVFLVVINCRNIFLGSPRGRRFVGICNLSNCGRQICECSSGTLFCHILPFVRHQLQR